MNAKQSKKKIDIRHSERALLTDTLPFELPIFFTNENLAILAHAKSDDETITKFHKTLLLAPNMEPRAPTKPYNYEVARISARPRRLSLPHPKSQHLMSLFYKKYETFIINACNRTEFSLRHPSRVATHYIESRYALPADQKVTNEADEDPAGFRNQSLWASTYFSYKDYNLIYKFFESEEFTALETRFPLLRTLDISRCFDSIYTHSIEWSMRGKDFSKNHLPSPARRRITFESTFDLLIRNANENETHGIIVGPETSRIFAEVILQSLDRSIAREIPDHKSNIAIRRYVDDYYIFGNNENDLDRVTEVIRQQLREVNLHLNDSKTHTHRRPFSTKTSAARARASLAVDNFVTKSIRSLVNPGQNSSSRHIELQRSQLIRELRSISVELEISYERFASIALTVLNRKLIEYHKTRINLNNAETSDLLARQAWLISCIRVAQFLFEIDCRVTTSLKLAKIYKISINLADQLSCSRAPLENQIIDGLRNESLGITMIETDEITRINHICAVDALLSDGRSIHHNDIVNYLGDYNSQKIEQTSPFCLLALLFLARRRRRFRDVRNAARDEITRRIRNEGTRLPIATDATLLLTDFLSCPYLEIDEKIPTLQDASIAVLGASCSIDEARSILERTSWICFTDWTGRADIGRMLARRELTPPYEAG